MCQFAILSLGNKQKFLNFTTSKVTVMKNYSVRQYLQSDYENWNEFINNAKNATFLFHRDFMEYHADVFVDYSLLVFDEKQLVSVLPANRIAGEVFSHQGLSYGGLVYGQNLKLASVIGIFKSVLVFLNERQVQKLHLKVVPSIYHLKPSEEISYALFLVKSHLQRRDSLSVIDLAKPIFWSKIRNRGIRNGIKNNLVIKETADCDEFWIKILIPHLQLRYNVSPVHTLQDINKLKKLFPNNIRQFNVYENEVIIAGTTIFESENVAHCQYISGKEGKNETGSIDFLFYHLIADVFKNKRFFDLGSSNGNQERQLNNGLSYWKESFGASTIVQDVYEVETGNYSLLDSVLI